MIDKGDTTIDKGDNFAGPRPRPALAATALTSAVVALVVSAATTFVILAAVRVRTDSAPAELAADLVQTGRVEPPLSNLQGEVYYPAPFRSTPNLEIVTPGTVPMLLERRKDGFKYKALTGAAFEWRARVLR